MSRSKAEKNFRLWHDKDPDGDFVVDARQLDEEFFTPVGWAENIVYESGKWEAPGTTYFYDHDFSSRPQVFFPASTVSRDEAVGTNRKTLRLLAIRNKKTENALALLGTVKELLMLDGDGQRVEVALGRRAYLCSTPDLKGLVVLSDKGVLIIRGGRMAVTSRGIVK